jgi:hypothetical protein
VSHVCAGVVEGDVAGKSVPLKRRRPLCTLPANLTIFQLLFPSAPPPTHRLIHRSQFPQQGRPGTWWLLDVWPACHRHGHRLCQAGARVQLRGLPEGGVPVVLSALCYPGTCTTTTTITHTRCTHWSPMGGMLWPMHPWKCVVGGWASTFCLVFSKSLHGGVTLPPPPPKAPAIV